jgi:phosphomannomutase/phosphoglucomutase
VVNLNTVAHSVADKLKVKNKSEAKINPDKTTDHPPTDSVKTVKKPTKSHSSSTPSVKNMHSEIKPENIFKAYDIRGIVGKGLSKEIVYEIGLALGSEAEQKGIKTIVVARDGRLSGTELIEVLMKGIISTGRNILNLGMVPTPVLYFVAQHIEGRSGIMLTGSHNPPEYNGLKMVLQGETLSGERIQQIKQRIETENFVTQTMGMVEHKHDYVEEYIGMIADDIRLNRRLKIVIDCGNGVAGELAPILIKTLNCEVIELYCQIDGHFPNHHPDPSKPENLTDLIAAVKQHQADLGLAFDGDGDRLGVVDSSGKIIWPDRQMMLYAKQVLAAKPGARIIYDVKCSRHLGDLIRKSGGFPQMWKTGHSLIKAQLKETGAALAGEMSGHIFFNDRWFGFDDALYTAARLLEIIAADSRSSADIFADFPDSINTPELTVELDEGENFTFIAEMIKKAHFPNATIIDIDGLRVEFKEGWGLVRASNTTPTLVVRFEADNEQALENIQHQIKKLMVEIKDDIYLPF